jgi:hypothetical protein
MDRDRGVIEAADLPIPITARLRVHNRSEEAELAILPLRPARWRWRLGQKGRGF